VQKALIDDEISEKKAGLLLYSLQMASSNLKHTTFTDSKKEVVTEMPVEPAVSTQQSALSQGKGKTLPLINGDITDPKPAVSTQQSAVSQKRLPKLPRLPESPELESKTKTFTTEAAEEHRGNGKPQTRAAVPPEHRVG
jgi:hypothetical protein